MPLSTFPTFVYRLQPELFFIKVSRRLKFNTNRFQALLTAGLCTTAEDGPDGGQSLAWLEVAQLGCFGRATANSRMRMPGYALPMMPLIIHFPCATFLW